MDWRQRMSIPADSVECPVCGRIVPAKQEECPGCGSDLAMSTLEELESIAKRLSDPEKPKETPRAPPEPQKEAPKKSEPEAPKPAIKAEAPKMEAPREKAKEQKPVEAPKPTEPKQDGEEKRGLGKLFGKRKK